MNIKKEIYLVLILLVLISISAVSAADDTASDIISADDNEEIILDEAIEEDASSANDNYDDELILEDPGDDFVGGADEDSAPKDILGDDTRTWSDLANEIGSGGNIELQHKYYIFDVNHDAGIYINISTPNSVIDGKGAIIDMAGYSVTLRVSASGIIIKDLTIKNARGNAAILFESSSAGTVENCNFTNNYAEYGSAIFFGMSSTGNVTNCNFTGSNASNNGGAVYFSSDGEVTNCSFTDSTASNNGGAVYVSGIGTLTNCSFVDNKATGAYSRGGAVYFSNTGEVTNCNFNNNTAEMGNAIYINNHCTISDCDFTSNPITKGAIHSVTGDIALSNNILNVDDAVSGRNFTEIQKLIDAANEGDEITIDGSYAGFGIPIRITKSLTLIGQNNAILDAKKLSKILYITASNVLIKNIQFTNGYAENGGAVFFEKSGNVENCNFTNNEVNGAKSSGGAIYLNGTGNVINSIFTANKATRNGGAIYVEAQSINNIFSCQFYNNYAVQSGGAILFHNLVQNNTFECIFKDNYAGYGAGIFFSKNANANRFNSDFINNTAKSCGGAMFFYGTTDKNNFTGRYINNSALGQIDPTNGNGGAITFKNVSTNSIFTCDFINNYARLNGGGVNYRETPKNIIFNANFINNTAKTGGGVNFFVTFDVIFNGEFIGNTAEYGGALAAGYGNVKNVSFKNNHAKNDGGAVYFALSGETVNCNFTNNTASKDGGAIWIYYGTVENCNFTDNTASEDGGAVYFYEQGNVTNCNFTNNKAEMYGGAMYFGFGFNGTVENCNLINNTASEDGGAIYFEYGFNGTVENCNFVRNSANRGGGIFSNDWTTTADTCIFKTDSDKNNYNVIICPPTLNVDDFTTIYGSGEKITFDLKTNSSNLVDNGNISISVYCKNNDSWVGNYSCLSGEEWAVELPVGSYYAIYNTEYAGFEAINRTITINKGAGQITAADVTATYNDDKYLVITLKDSGGNPISGGLLSVDLNGVKNYTTDSNGQVKVSTKGLIPKEYTATVSYADNDLYNGSSATAKVTIKKINTKLTAAKVTATYNVNKYLLITLKDVSGIVLANKKVSIKVGSIAKNLTTNAKGQVSILISKLVPKTYTASISFEGDSYYNKSSAKATVVVKKATPKLTAKAKTFRVKVKTKKYAITLKNNKGTVMKNTKVTLKVNKKTFTAKTNKKGVATFKITNLKKKGKFTAVIKYAGSKYYNKLTKKAKITVKK